MNLSSESPDQASGEHALGEHALGGGEAFASSSPAVPHHGSKSNSILTEKETRIASRVIIFGLLFGVTGALGLPILWLSNNFTGLEKALWTLIVTAYTLFLIVGTLGICWWAWNQVFPEGLLQQEAPS